MTESIVCADDGLCLQKLFGYCFLRDYLAGLPIGCFGMVHFVFFLIS